MRTFALALVLAAGLFTACGVPPERSILDQFFASSRLRDTTALSRFSTIIFEPLEQGIVVDFEITSVTREKDNRKDVTITAPVKRPDGEVVRKTLVVTLERGVLNDSPESARRWIVSGIRDYP